MDRSPTILLLAGEASGDEHGAAVARALLERWPEATLLGLGGRRMEAAGVELLAGLDRLAVMGFVEVLARLPFFWRLERRVKDLLDQGRVDLVLPVDYPGFNLRIARAARERGIPVLYYIAPQVWAWKPKRAARLARDADRIAVILPFEVEIFRDEGGSAEFVGHPLLEDRGEVPDREAFCRAHGLDPGAPILALFPGSRRQELDRHLALFLETAERLVGERPDLQPALALASSVERESLGDVSVPVVDDGRALLHHARAALVKSGTSTLEAALAGTPFVVVYRTHPVTWFLARRLVSVDHIALANLVADARVVPEVLQGEATPERLATLLSPLLDEGSEERRQVLRGLERVHEALEGPRAAHRVAELAAELLERPAEGDRSGSRDRRGAREGPRGGEEAP